MSSPSTIISNWITITAMLLCSLTSSVMAQKRLPRFEDYPVNERYAGKTAPLILSSPEVREYRTRLREGSREKPNFAGHFIIWTWGCGGGGCLEGGIIDVRNGRVVLLPSVCCGSFDSTGNEIHYPLEYHVNSSLIVLYGHIAQDDRSGPLPKSVRHQEAVFYYKVENDCLKLIRAVKQ